MKKIFLLLGIVVMLSMALAFAHGGDDFNRTKQIIGSKISCDNLSNEQLEEIGDYFMEVMHPGVAHEQMHEMMGGEDSATVKSMHINMARMMYCNEGSGMSNMMNMIGGNNMMGSGGMMNMMGGNMMSSGMMGNYPAYYGYNSFWNTFWLVFLIGLISLIVWLIYKFTKKGEESETPINILQKRYARGEINKKQFEEMKKELKG